MLPLVLNNKDLVLWEICGSSIVVKVEKYFHKVLDLAINSRKVQTGVRKATKVPATASSSICLFNGTFQFTNQLSYLI